MKDDLRNVHYSSKQLFAPNFKGYTDSEIRKIVKAGGGLAARRSRQALRQALHNEILMVRRLCEYRQCKRPSANTFDKISKASERLLKLFGVDITEGACDSSKDTPSFDTSNFNWVLQWAGIVEFGTQGSRILASRRDNRASIIHALNEVRRIRQWAKLEAGAMIVRVASQPKRQPTTEFVGRIARLYPKFFEGRFRIHKSSIVTDAMPAGAIVENDSIRFAQACLEPLGYIMKPDAIEQAWDQCRKDQLARRRSRGLEPRAHG